MLCRKLTALVCVAYLAQYLTHGGTQSRVVIFSMVILSHKCLPGTLLTLSKTTTRERSEHPTRPLGWVWLLAWEFHLESKRHKVAWEADSKPQGHQWITHWYWSLPHRKHPLLSAEWAFWIKYWGTAGRRPSSRSVKTWKSRPTVRTPCLHAGPGWSTWHATASTSFRHLT